MEEWRPIVGFEGTYEISNTGIVRGIERLKWNGAKMVKQKGRLIYGTKRNGAPYTIVTLCKQGKETKAYMHRLVAMAFIPNPYNHRTVNHIDGDPSNNCKDNLEWCSYSENHLHAYRVLKREHSKGMLGKTGSKHSLSKPILQIKDGNVVAIHESIRQAAFSVGVSNGNISGCCKNQNRKLKGFNWKYLINEDHVK